MKVLNDPPLPPALVDPWTRIGFPPLITAIASLLALVVVALAIRRSNRRSLEKHLEELKEVPQKSQDETPLSFEEEHRDFAVHEEKSGAGSRASEPRSHWNEQGPKS
ncbi:hypothetical protein [Arthrobacter sp. GAS37]|uniref:hypothetical protein n=1 Tax=Arthrobacter sp. GAS37 TaxID=3156261 RepID=UPI00385042DB